MSALRLVLGRRLDLKVGTARARLNICTEEGKLVDHTASTIALTRCRALTIWRGTATIVGIGVGLADAAAKFATTCTEAHTAKGFVAFLSALLVTDDTHVLKVRLARTICQLLDEVELKVWPIKVRLSA